MGNRNRNTALVLLAAGLFLLLQQHLGFFTITALLLIVLGLYKVRTESGRSGYWLLAAGALLLISSHFTIVLAILLISLGWFLIRTKKVRRDRNYVNKHRFVESLKWDRQPWVLKPMGLWHVIGETHMDLTFAIPEQAETTIVIQGIIGDVDIVVPDYLGVSVSASAVVGEIAVVGQKDTGILNKVIWQSPNYAWAKQTVHFELSYLIADIDIKVV